MALSYEQTEKVLQAAMAKAGEMSRNLSFAVVDEKGFPIALARMQGAGAATADFALGKARTSALFGGTSGVISERLPEGIRSSLVAQHAGRIMFRQGAVPISVDGQNVGAIGGSGNTSEKDEEAAQAGADAVK